MSTDLEQLFHDSVRTLPTSGVDLDLVVRRGRRVRARSRVRTAATIGVTGAVVVGVGSVALTSLGYGGTSHGPSVGAAAGGSVATSALGPTPTPVGPTASPVDTSSSGLIVKPSDAPAELTAITLPSPAPLFGPRRFPDSVSLTGGLDGRSVYWVATFGVGVAGGREATVMIGRFPMPATSGIPTIAQSPGPITDHPTVAGFPAYVTHDGAQTILYFQTSRFTVEVTGEHASVADLVTLAESLRGIA